MDWFLYDNGLSHERVKSTIISFRQVFLYADILDTFEIFIMQIFFFFFLFLKHYLLGHHISTETLSSHFCNLLLGSRNALRPYGCPSCRQESKTKYLLKWVFQPQKVSWCNEGRTRLQSLEQIPWANTCSELLSCVFIADLYWPTENTLKRWINWVKKNLLNSSIGNSIYFMYFM